MWYGKMYVSGRHEIFEFDAYGVQGAPSARKVLPFLESLLSFLELDCGKLHRCSRRLATAGSAELPRVTGRQEQQP